MSTSERDEQNQRCLMKDEGSATRHRGDHDSPHARIDAGTLRGDSGDSCSNRSTFSHRTRYLRLIQIEAPVEVVEAFAPGTREECEDSLRHRAVRLMCFGLPDMPAPVRVAIDRYCQTFSASFLLREHLGGAGQRRVFTDESATTRRLLEQRYWPGSVSGKSLLNVRVLVVGMPRTAASGLRSHLGRFRSNLHGALLC
jgi:hypothetical protein